ncbi:hypothetical protein [Ruegeria marina]|uniref:DUF7742 domain-containing protein n=1 Tax=Ruegeria marina TaxID=639004 RepID=A0A1G6XF58_9RHOB|nr:hypothetical protein [Ruegeria marina]SDD76701.1 hypothetical protein SAMN04488239_11062 [Ruegeria marina]
MLPVLHGDVCAAARVLLRTPPTSREALCRRMIVEADVADRHLRRTGRPHPLFGNGSLMSAARKRVLADEPGFDDPDYCLCFETVLRALVARSQEVFGT